VAVCLVPLAVWILLSGLDDLFIDLVYFLKRRKRFPWPSEKTLTEASQRRIAIFLPLWHEHEVIGQMLRHNLSAIRYGNYDFFVGIYPNDLLTRQAVERVMSEDARVHVAVCPHDGPTSKGDCLNWIYKGMATYETRCGIDFEILVTHDAEDLIHPEALHLINWFMRDHKMVQIPVVPLSTRIQEWTHGLYCDEFAEYQFKDIPVRQQLGGFLPSNGVGTGFDRSALEHLRRCHGGRIFDPDCLTEDYENGFRMHAAGYRQIFVPIHLAAEGPVATREYFPRKWRAAIRQRSRWVAGISLQGWQHHGWRGPVGRKYWFWRDRKGLIGNLLSPPANLLFLFWAASAVAGIHARARSGTLGVTSPPGCRAFVVFRPRYRRCKWVCAYTSALACTAFGLPRRHQYGFSGETGSIARPPSRRCTSSSRHTGDVVR
jgi:bacteriophage N4 adsorption protein B